MFSFRLILPETQADCYMSYVTGNFAEVNRASSDLVDQTRSGLEAAYAGNQLSSFYTLTDTSAVGATVVEVQGPVVDGNGSKDPDHPSISSLSFQEMASSVTNESRGGTKSQSDR